MELAERIKGDFSWKIFLNQCHDFKDSKTNSWKKFSEDVPVIVPVIAMTAFYWIDSIFLWNDSLKARS